MSETILITGGFGYIGRHTCIELLKSGYNVVIVDNKKMEDLEEINNNIFKISGK
jgi:UDP-glucose 4-epimerase